ncbi:MAG: VWA domain-containing protein [Clostridiales bacterium]|nr:VWA domain-containing protein [Clostridiales bacterium]
MALSADKIYFIILIPIIIAAVIFIKKKYMGSDRYTDISTVLRTLTVILLILSLSGMSIVDKARNETTVYLADVSDSASNSTERIAQFIESAQSYKGTGDQTAAAVFAGRAVTTIQTTDEYVTVNLDTGLADKDNTNIETAIKHALSIYDDDTKKRLVLITDGSETKGDAVSVRNLLKTENVQTLIYDISGDVEIEAGIREISMPQYVNINMSYDVNVIIDSIGSQRANLRLYRGSALVVNEEIKLKDGENRYVFTDMAEKGGGITYHAEIVPENDTFYQNNSIYGYCYAENLPSVLVVGTGESAENMRLLLESAQLNVDVVVPSEAPMSYDTLIAYDTVVLADTAYDELNEDFITALDSFVRYAGGGLIAIGGENSYGPGGYEGTLLEDMLPVEMDIKTQSEDPDLAMIFIIDRSGSMADTSQGISCMDVAKEAALRGVDEMDADDIIGVIAFDTQAQWVVEPQTVGDNIDEIGEAIATIQAGGGTSILPALRMACQELAETDTKLKHIILLTDGQAETEGYTNLLNKAREDGITISTIAVGQGADTSLLEYIAEAGNGRYYYADQYSTLPEIFVYETTIASKDYINNEDFYPTAVDSSEITENIDSVPMLHGYVSTTAKSRADVVLESDEEEPILAVWQYGLGRTAAWTSDFSGQWTSDWITSDEGIEIIRNLISYTMRSDILYDIEVTGEASGGVSTVTAKLPVNQNTVGVTALIKTAEGVEYNVDMSASLPGEYTCTIPTDEEGAYIITVTEELSDGETNAYNTGFIIGYSKEYDTRNMNDNGVIDELASYDGISLITSPDEVYSSSLPDSYAKRDISVPLVIMALILLIIDILLRRFPEITDKICSALLKLKLKKKAKKDFAERIKENNTKEKEKEKEKQKKPENTDAEAPVKKSSSSALADMKRNRRK